MVDCLISIISIPAGTHAQVCRNGNRSVVVRQTTWGPICREIITVAPGGGGINFGSRSPRESYVHANGAQNKKLERKESVFFYVDRHMPVVSALDELEYFIATKGRSILTIVRAETNHLQLPSYLDCHVQYESKLNLIVTYTLCMKGLSGLAVNKRTHKNKVKKFVLP